MKCFKRKVIWSAVGLYAYCVLLLFLYYKNTVFAPVPHDTQYFTLKSEQITVSAAPKVRPLLTLFTTFTNNSEKFHIHMNVLRNWAAFLPDVLPVLFVSDIHTPLSKTAKILGWEVNQEPRVNTFGTPYFKDMFLYVNSLYNSSFYGYCNGDILFDQGLVDSVNAVSSFLHNNSATIKQLLIIGRRTNYRVSAGQDLHHIQDVNLEAKSKGKLFIPDAIDYFLLSGGSFPWGDVQDVVVGRPGYDNYLVALALRRGVAVVDAMATLLALHQTDNDGNFAGQRLSSRERHHNTKVIGKFDSTKGTTVWAQLETRPHKHGPGVAVWRRGAAFYKAYKLWVKKRIERCLRVQMALEESSY